MCNVFFKRATTALLLTIFLGGCGQKGSLYIQNGPTDVPRPSVPVPSSLPTS